MTTEEAAHRRDGATRRGSMGRGSAQGVRGRAIGICVSALIGCGWVTYGLASFGALVRILIALPAAVVVVALLSGARRLFAIARELPRPSVDGRVANRRVWAFFWINVVVEVALLNVAVGLLSDQALRVYWIPAISLVVGLHFVPMAFFFRAPSFFGCAAAMMLASAVTAVAIFADPPRSTLLVSLESLVNAAILWSTAAWGVKTLAGLARPLRETGA